METYGGRRNYGRHNNTKLIKDSYPEIDTGYLYTEDTRISSAQVQSYSSQKENFGKGMERNIQGAQHHTICNTISTRQHDGVTDSSRSSTESESFLYSSGEDGGRSKPLHTTGWGDNTTFIRNTDAICERSTQNAQLRVFDSSSKVYTRNNRTGNCSTESFSEIRSVERATRDIEEKTDAGQEGINKQPRRIIGVPDNIWEVEQANITEEGSINPSLIKKLTTEMRGTTLRLGTLNISGFNNAKAMKIRAFIEKHELNYLVLTETRAKLNRDLIGRGKQYRIYGESQENTGVAIVVRGNQSEEPELASERILQYTMKNGISIIGAYAPTEVSSQHERQIFWKNLKEIVKQSVENDRVTIIIGDLNAGHEDRIGGSKTIGSTNFEMLTEIVRIFNMHILNTKPTWKSNRTNRPTRTLDRCIVHTSTEYKQDTELDWEQQWTDHAGLIVKLDLKEIDRSIGRQRTLQMKKAWIDDQWGECKKRIKSYKSLQNVMDSADPLRIFWKALKDDELASRESLMILDANDITLDDQEAVDALAEYYKSLWTREEHSQIDFTANEEVTQSPTVKEIHEAIAYLKKDTARGLDNLSTNFIKSNPSIATCYKEFLDILWTNPEEMPIQWKAIRIKPIIKQEPKTIPSQTRPIACLPTSLKILNRIIATRNYDRYERVMHANMHAYRRKRSTLTAIAAFLNNIDSRDTPTVVSLDISKAFDSVSRKMLEKALNKWDLPRNEALLIIAQYNECEVFIEKNGKRAQPFYHTCGIKQGCTLSGMLWNLVASMVYEELERIFPNMKAVVLSYADDFLIIADKLIEAQVIKKVLKEVLSNFGLILNDGKEITMKFKVPGAEEKDFKWLGVIFTSYLNWEKEALQRIEKAKKASVTIKKICRDNGLRMPTKLMIQIINVLVVVYFTSDKGMLEFNELQKDRFMNIIQESILENTNVSPNTAAILAKQLFTCNAALEELEEDVEISDGNKAQSDDQNTQKLPRNKKIIPKLRSRSALPNAIYIAPTQQDIQKRLEELNALKQERFKCTNCDYMATHSGCMKEHRKRMHGLPPLEVLRITCKNCGRVFSKGYAKHLCVDRTDLSTQNIRCSFCQRYFSKHGIINHQAACQAINE